MRLSLRSVPFLLGVLIAAGAACRDATAPRPVHSFVGVYDVTTVLDSFSFETGAPSPPDCPDRGFYCTHVRGYTGATLSGTLTIGDGVSGSGPSLAYAQVSANMGGQFCDSATVPDGCIHTKDTGLLALTQGSIARSPDAPFATDSSFTITVGGTNASSGVNGPIIRFEARSAGDSLYGTVLRSLYVYRSPPTHWGTFVARRRR